MESAKQVAARIGYEEIYLTAAVRPDLDELAAALAARGLAPVGQRMLDHYGRMFRRGVLTYIPINEFDMAVKHGTLRNAS